MATSGNQQGIDKVEKLVKLFRMMDSEMPMQTALAFLFVANNDGKKKETTMSDIARHVGLQQGSITRNVSNLSDWTYKKTKGMNLVKMTYDPMDSRRKLVTLTSKGKTFVNQLEDVIK
jgi:DNA-binding MarR family transcriptional regulator